jgi:hypothetical protein
MIVVFIVVAATVIASNISIYTIIVATLHLHLLF